jgi:beta-glucanase (GH16 family)
MHFIWKAVRGAAMSEALRGASKARIAALMVLLILSMLACGGSPGSTPESCPADEIGTPPTCFTAPPAPAAPGKTWHVAFSEEFNGNDYDHNKLTPCFDWNYDNGCTSSFNNGKETYKPEQVRVSDGTAKLVAEPLSPPEPDERCYQGICTYKAGLLSTARPHADNDSQYLFPFTYGYVEARIKYPAVPGFFTAFWMMPTNPTYEYRTEIDIVEILGGNPATAYMTYHYNDRAESYKANNFPANDQPPDNGACPVRDYSQDWVRFGVDWQPDHIAWYINGVKCGEFTDAARIENGPMQLILNMMIDNNWERDAGSVLANQTLVNQLEVDYIRVYQQQ